MIDMIPGRTIYVFIRTQDIMSKRNGMMYQ